MKLMKPLLLGKPVQEKVEEIYLNSKMIKMINKIWSMLIILVINSNNNKSEKAFDCELGLY